MLAPLGLGLLVCTFVFMIGNLFRLVEESINNGLSPLLIIQLIITIMPGIMSITIPMSVLVAVLLGIGRLAADREILAIRMNGINLMHICFPLLVLAGLLSGLLIYANHNLVPYLNLCSVDLATQAASRMLSSVPPDEFHELDAGKGGPSSVFFFDFRDEKTGEMRGVNIRTQMEVGDSEEQKKQDEEKKAALRAKAGLTSGGLKRKDGLSSASRQLKAQLEKEKAQLDKDKQSRVRELLIVADRGRIVADIPKRLIEVHLTSGSIHAINPDKPEAYTIVGFETFTKGITPKEPETKPRQMSMAVLRQKMLDIKKEVKQAKDSSKRKELRKRLGSFSVEYWQRFSIPLACLAFALIGIPLAVYVRPTGKAIAFAISFLLILLYYGLLQYGESLGRTGNSYAPFAIFFPNILLSVVGSWLLYRMVMK